MPLLLDHKQRRTAFVSSSTRFVSLLLFRSIPTIFMSSSPFEAIREQLQRRSAGKSRFVRKKNGYRDMVIRDSLHSSVTVHCVSLSACLSDMVRCLVLCPQLAQALIYCSTVMLPNI